MSIAYRILLTAADRVSELILARTALRKAVVSGRERPGSHPIRNGIG